MFYINKTVLFYDYKMSNKNPFFNKEQYCVDKSTDFKNKINQIIELINREASIDFDWSKSKNLANLDEDKLAKIQKAVAGRAQSELVSIFYSLY